MSLCGDWCTWWMDIFSVFKWESFLRSSILLTMWPGISNCCGIPNTFSVGFWHSIKCVGAWWPCFLWGTCKSGMLLASSKWIRSDSCVAVSGICEVHLLWLCPQFSWQWTTWKGVGGSCPVAPHEYSAHSLLFFLLSSVAVGVNEQSRSSGETHPRPACLDSGCS